MLNVTLLWLQLTVSTLTPFANRQAASLCCYFMGKNNLVNGSMSRGLKKSVSEKSWFLVTGNANTDCNQMNHLYTRLKKKPHSYY